MSNTLFNLRNQIHKVALILSVLMLTLSPSIALAGSKAEQAIAIEIDQMPKLEDGIVVDFQKTESGFNVNGEEFMDFEGDVKVPNWDPLTGNVTYLTREPDGSYIIKFVRAGVDAEPIVIGTVGGNKRGWKAITTSGKKIGGDDFRTTSNGFLILRGKSVYRYTVGKGVKAAPSPKGFNFWAKQFGDPGSTGWVLLGKRSGSSAPSFGSFLNSALGMEGSSDFGLLNIETKKFTELLIANRDQGKTVENRILGGMSDNMNHISHRLRWFKDVTGTYAIYTKNNLKEAVVINLETGVEKPIVTTTVGHIHDLSYQMQNNGKAKVIADMGSISGKVVIDDIAAFMAKPVEVKGKKVTKN